MPPALEAQSPNRWTTREVPQQMFLIHSVLLDFPESVTFALKG